MIFISVCPGCLSIYHLIPLGFVLAGIITGVLTCIGIWQLSALLWGAYFLATVIMSLFAAFGAYRFNIYYFLLPILFLLLHVGYGTGTLVGITRIPGWKKSLKKCHN